MMIDDPLQPFRQPVVTSAVVIFGFVLNFTFDFVRGETKDNPTAHVIGLLVIAGMCLLLNAIRRILRKDYPRHNVDRYYQVTLRQLLLGALLALIGALFHAVNTFLTT